MAKKAHDSPGTHGTVRCFGKFSVHLHGRAFGRGGRTFERFRTQKTASLLAYLTINSHRTHSRESLIDMFWPDQSLVNGRHSLSVAMSSIRAQIEPPQIPEGALVTMNRASIGIQTGTLVTDVAQFEALVERAEKAAAKGDMAFAKECADKANALYDVPLLEGFYDAWIAREQSRVEAILSRLDAVEPQERPASPSESPAQESTSESPEKKASHRQLASAQMFGIEENQFGIVRTTAVPADSQRASGEVRDDEAPRQELASPASFLEMPTPILPIPPTRFYGRDPEQTSLSSLLADPAARLITLIGPGGVGKTRIALAAAHRILHDENCVRALYFVSLVEISRGGAATGEQLVDAVYETVYESVFEGVLEKRAGYAKRVSQVDQGELITILSRYLNYQDDPILVLDNVEQISDVVAGVVETLLARVPELTLLVTSRQRLNIDGEHIVPVEPLPLPSYNPKSFTSDDEAADAFEALRNSPSVALFVDRAQSSSPGFRVTGQNAASIVRVVNYLEGIPLALELAATWVRAYTPAQMVTAREGRFSFPKRTDSRRPGRARHGSILNALSWSYNLLSTRLQKAFAALSVFRGSFSAEAAESVLAATITDGEWVEGFDVYDILAQLGDASLLQSVVSGEGDESIYRFRMLETVRDFAEKCLRAEEKPKAQFAHAHYFLAFAEEREAEAAATSVTKTMREEIEQEEIHLRAALDLVEADANSGSETEAQSALLHMRMANALHRYWLVRGRITEGRTRLETSLLFRSLVRVPEILPISLEAKLVNEAGIFAMTQGDDASATALFEESLALCDQQKDLRCRGLALSNLATLATRREDFSTARSYYEESLLVWREVGDKRIIGILLANLSGIANDSGDLPQARALLTESVEIARILGGGAALSSRVRNLAEVFYKENNLAQAEAGYRESIRLSYDLRDATGTASALVGLGLVSVARGESDFALSLISLALNALKSNNVPLGKYAQKELARLGLNNFIVTENAEDSLWKTVERLLSSG